MVMHARKHPRIDDGYPDKREAQPFQSSQYPSKSYSSNHSDRYDRRRSPTGRDSPSSRDSPRYIHKSSYIERNKERGQGISPGKKVSNYGSSSHHSTNTNNGGSHDSRNLSARSSSTTNSKDKTEVQKSAIRTCGDWSEHLSSMGKKYYYNIKSETSQWERPREWSDSSAVRPDDHSSENRTNDRRSSKDSKSRHSSGGLEKRDKYLDDVRRLVADSNPKPDKIYLLHKLQQSHTEMQHANRHIHSDSAPKDGSHRRSCTNNDSSSNDYPNASSHPSRSRRDSEGSRPLPRQSSRNDPDDIDSPGSTPTSHRSGSTPHGCLNPVANISSANLNISNIPNLIRQIGGQNSQELTNKALQTLQKLQQALSRQIIAHQTSVASQSSQSSTIQASPRHHMAQLHDESQTVSSYQHPVLHQHPQHSVNQSITGSLQHAPGTLSAGHPGATHRSPYINNSQNSLSLSQSHSPHIIETQAMTVSPVATTTGTTGTIPITHTGNHVHRGNTVYGKFLGSQNQTAAPNYSQTIDDPTLGENSKVNDGGGGGSNRSSCGSPTPSDTSSQGAPVDPDMFSSNLGQKDTNIMSSLGQYYHENSVAHVTGWQGELFEKQARLYRDEALKIGSLISSQVSVELKRARSLVRVEEIQATLHEQRNLFLAQQIAELENMKPVSSVASFLPTATTSAPTTS